MTTIDTSLRRRYSSKKRSRRIGNAVSLVVLSIGAVVMLLPFVWMIATSLKPAGEVFQYPPTFSAVPSTGTTTGRC
ncbi:hypothetical protein GTU79_10985 [Sodalis ligni]|uniref:hypothetical protein n=1 Tax=Sodalis ligni TaxID=2697027 RepID=UPI001BDDCE39|nr:hypothetical protein [Sodalis ligni]QWA13131.1 hypothetical protein GTU79_10985 [Sodalis ligni]